MNDGFEIPEEAVEAAAKAEWLRFGLPYPDAQWEVGDIGHKDHLRTVMRNALKAAQPQMHRVINSEEGLLPGTVLQDRTGDVLKLMPDGEWWATDCEGPTFVEYPARVLVEGTV
jgi:hypothetical protein